DHTDTTGARSGNEADPPPSPCPGRSGPVLCRTSGGESQKTGGEGVHVVDAADRADLPRREETRDRDVAQRTAHGERVVIRVWEHRLAAPVTGEQQPRAHTMARTELGQALGEVLVGGAGVAHLETHRLTDLDHVTDGERTRVRFGPGQGA